MNQTNINHGLPLIRPKILPELDAAFCPAVLANRAFRHAAGNSGRAVPVLLALERADGSVSRFETHVDSQVQGNFVFLERLLKFLL